jgi:hypothetical protein
MSADATAWAVTAVIVLALFGLVATARWRWR